MSFEGYGLYGYGQELRMPSLRRGDFVEFSPEEFVPVDITVFHAVPMD